MHRDGILPDSCLVLFCPNLNAHAQALRWGMSEPAVPDKALPCITIALDLDWWD